MARCFVTRELPGTALERLARAHDVEIWRTRLPPTPEQLRQRAAGADGLLTLLTDRVDAALLDGCPRLRAISNYAVGCDNIDLATASERGIPVGNTPDVLTDATADLAWALLLAAARRLPQARDAALAGDWPTWEPAAHLGASVHGATLGIVGFGRIGRAVAARAVGFEMTVLRSGRAAELGDTVTASAAHAPQPATAAGGGLPGERGPARAGGPDRSPVKTSLDDLLERSDFVSLHCPLTPETHHLIDARALRLMRPGAILVNTARGGVVDTNALLAALREGRIGGAALDVTEPEPLPADHPLMRAPNALIVPHIGSATHAARERMADMAVDNLLAALDGRPMPHKADG